MTFKIRPHHALCLMFFRGKGYSSAFTDNMSSIHKALNTGAQVEIVRGTDDICAVCPNNHDGHCEQEANVRGYDERTASLLGFSGHTIIDYHILREAVENKILKEGLLSGICGGCKWHGLCEEIRRTMQEG